MGRGLPLRPRLFIIPAANQRARMQMSSQRRIVPAQAVTSAAHLSVWLRKDSDRSNRGPEGSQPGRGPLSGRNILTISTAGSGINTRFCFCRPAAQHHHSPARLGSARHGPGDTSCFYLENKGGGCFFCSSFALFSFCPPPEPPPPPASAALIDPH